MLALLLLMSCVGCGLTTPATNGGDRSFSIYETEQNIISQGYHAETHQVITDDGYILEMHRIPYKRYQNTTDDGERPVVFLMHGLQAASNAMIILAPEYSIAYNLADAGFDVWMGNARGTRNSRRHVTLDPDHDVEKFEFFDFTFEEIGIYDIPAMVDYALEHTGREKLHYIGHSQGSTAFLILNAMRTEYSVKFASAHLLACVGYQEYYPHTLAAAIAPFTDILYSLALRFGIVEIFPPSWTGTTEVDNRVSDKCAQNVDYKFICDLIGVRRVKSDEMAPRDIFEIYEPAGAASKQYAHFSQGVRDKLFRRFDYGVKNLEVYGSTNPPIYNLSQITVNITMHYTVSDHVLDERDVLAMTADMPNAIARRVARDTFLHDDFLIALDARELVTEYIIDAIKNVSSSQSDQETEDENDVTDNDADYVTDSSSSLVLSNILNVCLIIYIIRYLVNYL